MRLVDFEAWAIFASVARLGNFTKAADLHGLSKPTISKAVSRLEAQLGSALFHRTSRKLSLSVTGEKLLPYAQNIMDGGEKAIEAAGDEVDILSGPIKISAPISFGLSDVAPIIAKFMDRFPDIILDVTLTDEQVDLIEDSYDLAIRIGALKDSSLIATKIRNIKSYFVASPRYFKNHKIPNHPRDLVHLDTILYANTIDRWILHRAGDTDLTINPQKRFVSNNGDLMLYPILAGHGIGHLPDFFCDQYLKNGQLVSFLNDWKREALSLYIITPPSRYRSARVRALIEFLKSELS